LQRFFIRGLIGGAVKGWDTHTDPFYFY
jgi:hypothetical protein